VVDSPFTRIVPGAYPKRLIAAVWGLPKSGKTHHSLTWPQPIYDLNFDVGLEELLTHPEFKDHEVHQVLDQHGRNKLYVPSVFNLQQSLGIMKEFDGAYEWALQNAVGGTVVVDTATQLHQLAQDIDLQRVKDIRRRRMEKKGEEYDETLFPFDYQGVNRRMRGLHIKATQYPGVNVLFVYRAREMYDSGGKPMGRFEPQWFSETASLVQLVVRMEREVERAANRDGAAQWKIMGTVEHNRWTMDTIGWRIERPTYKDLTLAAGWE
jgi:hypothetical protein